MEIDVAPPRCITCSKPMVFAGRIIVPAESIYRCELCHTETWVGEGWRAATAAAAERPQAQQQQQQQTRPKSKG